MKGCAPSLILKVGVFRTRKWPTDYKNKLSDHFAGCKAWCTKADGNGSVYSG